VQTVVQVVLCLVTPTELALAIVRVTVVNLGLLLTVPLGLQVGAVTVHLSEVVVVVPLVREELQLLVLGYLEHLLVLHFLTAQVELEVHHN
jgi:hypothetical protein